MMLGFISVCNSEKKIRKVVCGSFRAYFFKLYQEFYLGRVFCCWLGFSGKCRMFLCQMRSHHVACSS